MSARSDLHAHQDCLVLGAFTDAVPRETREVATTTGLNMKATRDALLRARINGSASWYA